MDLSCLKTEFTMKLYKNTIPYLLFVLEHLSYGIDIFASILEVLVTLSLTLLLATTIGIYQGTFWLWDAFMDYTKRKHYMKDGLCYNVLFYKKDSPIGNVFVFNKIKNSSQMNRIKDISYHITCVLSGSYREYYQVRGSHTSTQWMRIRRNPGHCKYETNGQDYRIELAENIKSNEPWILSIQLKYTDWLPFLNQRSSSQKDDIKVNYFEIDQEYHADSEDNQIETIDEDEDDDVSTSTSISCENNENNGNNENELQKSDSERSE